MLIHRCRCAFPAIWFVILTTHAIAGQEPAIRVPLVDAHLRQLIQERDWEAAIAAVDKALGQQDSQADRLAYLKGRILFLQGKHDAAVTAFGELEKQYPNSRWVRRARFASGVALAKKGDWHAAELVYKNEAEALVSAERRQGFADIYLEYADAFFDPQDNDVKPDYRKALLFYEKALDAGPSLEKQLDVKLLIARCYQLLGNNGEATKRYKAFIDAHPDSPQVVEARYRLGKRYLSNNRAEARRVWQDLLAIHAESPSKWVAEASFELSRTWEVPKPKTDEQMNMGVAALKRFLARFPSHEHAGQAHLDIASSYMERKRFEDAAHQLQDLLADNRYQARDEIPQARQRLGQAYVMQERFEHALAVWEEFLAKHPSDAAWSDVQHQVIDTQYTIAAGKVEARQFDAARQLLTEFLAKYPLDKRGPEILFLFGHMNFEQEKWDAAIDDWRRVVSKFPKTDEASHAQYQIAAVLEKKLGRFSEALEQYKKSDRWRLCATSQRSGGASHLQDNDPRHGASVSIEREAAVQTDDSKHRIGHDSCLQDQHGILLPENAPGRKRGQPGHRVDRPRREFRIRHPGLSGTSTAGEYGRHSFASRISPAERWP